MGAVLGFEYEPFYAELVRRAFYGDAPGGPVPAGIILANDRIEWAVLRREIPVSLQAGVGGAVGTFSFTQFTVGPPVDSILVVERLWVISAASAFGVELVSPPLASTASTRALTRDQRLKSIVAFASIANNLAGAGLANTPYPATPAQGEEIPIRPFVVGTLPLGAQTALVVAVNTANTAVSAIAYGYQRRLRPEELRLET